MTLGPPLEDLIQNTEKSVYKLVILAAWRALELAEGDNKLTKKEVRNKPTAIALEEIAEGKIKIKSIKDKEKKK